jgi:hypothetical protein
MEGSGHRCGCISLWITRIAMIMIMISLQQPGFADGYRYNSMKEKVLFVSPLLFSG